MTAPTIQDGDPPAYGTYIAYVDHEVSIRFAQRRMLTWDGSQWFYPLSDQRHRAHVYGWIGPLPAMELTD